jgi:hypothetical protein
MPLIKQTAYISPSPVTATIGGTFQLPLPPTIIVPAYSIQDGSEIITTGRGLWVSGFDYYGTSAVGATSFSFPDIEGCYGSFMASLPSSITTISAPNLTYLGSNSFGAAPTTYASLTSISLPKLRIASGLFSNNTMNALTSLDLSLLISGSFSPTSINGLTSLSLPSVKFLSTFSIPNATSLTSISTPSLVSVAQLTLGNLSACTTWTLPTLGTWKVLTTSFTITSCAFNQTTVDNILAALAYMDGTNNTLVFSSANARTVTITGTSSAPTNLGSTTTAGSNFVGAGTTCTVNLTSHGYATDDVLRISGITTLTNANRYARITVVNANQFTYTITSQTATGAGTATIVKAAASAKALVTRGVTLTTN